MVSCRLNTFMKSIFAFFLLLGLLLWEKPAHANVPGGGTNGAAVTLTDNGTTVTLANGIVSITCTKSSAQIGIINYTFNNTGTTQTLNLVSGNANGGKLYWENCNNEGLTFTYSIVANTTNYAEIALVSTTVANCIMEVHYSLLRGATGFYVTPIWSHASTNGYFSMGECRDNIYAGSIFNWMSVDAARNRLMEVSGGAVINPVNGAPVEVSLWTNGIYAGQYEDKYKYSTDFGNQHVYGWSSVGTGGKNVGLWNIQASLEYHQNGPMKRDLMEHIGTTILNMLNSGHYGGGANDAYWGAGEVWTKVYGPYFIYCNNVTNTLTGTNPPAMALYADAQAQALAEQGIDTNGQPTGAVGAWPYYWFTNANYATASGRGVLTGKFVINDTYNPNASAAGLWVGVMQQPTTISNIYDFQAWMKNYQFWVKTDTNGNFTIPNVIAGTNYTLYAFGPGAAGTFQSQSQTGGNSPNTFDLPATPFSVTVAAGATNSLGTKIWTPTRVGATVFEIGYPSRTGQNKFRHGDDYWVGDIGPKPTAPSPIWSKWLQYPFDFPNGVNYTVGQSRWTTDWNFVQPCVVDSTGIYDDSSSTITFNLPSAPSGSASFYMALCSDYQGAIEISVNGTQISPANGYNPNYMGSSYECDTTIREGVNADYSDNRINFSTSLLQAGQNTITIYMRQTAKINVNGVPDGNFSDHAMYDYVRLELSGYVPPPPASATAYAGNNCNLVCWPLVSGATSYNVLRATNASGTFVSMTNGVTGPICGSGAVNATWLDTTAGNGTNYFYVVRSVNPVGSSTNSPASPGATPSAGISSSAPPAPTGLTVAGVAHQSVSLNWSAVSGANYYSVFRSILVNTGGGSSNVLNTILLNNAVTNTTYTDASPTDGGIYSYVVTATSAGGTSTNSPLAVAVPLPAAPATLPVSLTASFTYSSTTNITLNWLPVPGAVGYAIYRATSSAGPYTYLQTVTETTYTDYTVNPSTIYYYRVAAVNDAGVSANASDLVNSQQTFPTNLTATATNGQISLVWPVTTGATSYTLKRGTSSGNETVTVVTGYNGTTYTNTGLANGTTYYYVVTATGAGGTSGNSPEVSATPEASGNGIWLSTSSGNWSAATNWVGNGIASGSSSIADFSTLSLPTNLTVTLDSARSIGSLIFGDTTATYNWTLAGTNTLTLGIGPAINVKNQSVTIATPLAGTNGLIKIGSGALTLGGATNNFTGGVSINSGSLALNYSATNSPVTNMIPAANSLTFGGGALQITGNGGIGSTQNFAGLTLNVGASVVAGTNLPVVNLAGIAENIGGTVEFIGPATINSTGTVAATATITTTTTPGTAGVLGGLGLGGNGAFATVGLYDWATTNTTTSPYTIVGGSQVAGFYQTAGVTTGGNYDVNGSGVNTIGNTGGANTLRFNQNAALTVNNSAFTFQNCQGILVTPNCGTHNETLSGASLDFYRSQFSGQSYGVIWQNNAQGYFNCSIPLNDGKQAGQNNGLVQAGPGTVVYGAANYYTLGTYLAGGFSVVTAYSGFGQTNNGYNSVSSVTLNGGTVVGNATFTHDQSGANARQFWLGNNGGGLAATAGNTMTVDGYIGGTGQLAIGIPASSANGNTLGQLPGSGSGTANTTPVMATGTVVLNSAGNGFAGGTVLYSGTVNINSLWALGGAVYGGLTFAGGNLQYAAALLNSAVDLTQDTSAGGTGLGGGVAKPVTLAASATIDVNGNAIAYTNTFGNGGSGALLVKSSLPGGSLNLLSANNYSGTTTVSNATLLVNNLTGSATGAGNVQVLNGGILSGNGAVASSVTVAAGGTLAVGNASDSLSIGNNLTLNSGSTLRFQIQPSPLTNSSVTVAGTLTFGGAVIVTNLGGALVSGDSFQLFNANGIAGAVSTLTLPGLTNGLYWNTNLFFTSGTLVVATIPSPVIGNVSLTGTQLLLSGNGGAVGRNYYLLSATNLATPLTNWTRLLTNQFDAGGNFNLSNGFAPGSPSQFYRLQSF